MDTQEEIIKYLIAGVLEKEGTLGKTKLVKLLYLMDVDQYSRYRRTASGLSWKYHFYGPYDPQIESVLRRIDLDVPQEEVQTSGGARAVAFRPSNISGLLDRVRLSDRLRRSAERILDQWALADLYSVLNHVYFHTEPMMDARPAQTLDFSVIPEYQPPRPPRNLPRPGHDTLLAIRRQLDHIWESYSGTFNAAISRSRAGEWAVALRNRLHLVYGEVDRTCPVKAAISTLGNRSGARIKVIEGGDHHLPLRQARLCAEYLNGVV